MLYFTNCEIIPAYFLKIKFLQIKYLTKKCFPSAKFLLDIHKIKILKNIH